MDNYIAKKLIILLIHIEHLNNYIINMSSIKKWTKFEETQLIKEIKCNTSIDEICRNHNRSKKAITYRLYNVAYRIFNNKNVPMEKICDTLKIDIESFKQVINNIPLYNTIEKVNRPLTYITCEDQFIDNDTETTEDSTKKYICTKCLKYESIINNFMMEFESVKSKNKKPAEQMTFDIYSDESDVYEEVIN